MPWKRQEAHTREVATGQGCPRARLVCLLGASRKKIIVQKISKSYATRSLARGHYSPFPPSHIRVVGNRALNRPYETRE